MERKKTTMRLEYLFPCIDDKRKLETLHNATLRPSIERGGKYFKIGVKNGELGLTTSDFYYLYNHREVVHTDYFNQYVTTLQNETNIFSLGFDGLWNEKFLDLIADYIVNNPNSLPYFLQDNALSILGLFLENHVFFYETYDMLNLNHNHIWESQRKDIDDYCWSNFLAKRKLSLFLCVVDKLLSRRVNLSEYRFTRLGLDATYANVITSEPWYAEILKSIPEEGYQNSDGQTISAECLRTLISFDDLDGFLNSIKTIASFDHLYVYNDRMMLKPFGIDITVQAYKQDYDPSKNSVFDNLYAKYYPKGSVIDIVECCALFQQKLASVSKETDFVILSRRLNNIKEAIKVAEQTPDFDWSILKNSLQGIYDEIKHLPVDAQSELLKSIDNLTKTGKLELKRERKSDSSIEGRVSHLEEVVASHESRLDSLDRRITNLEEALSSVFDYIDKGTPLPDDVAHYLSRMSILKVIAYPVKTQKSTLRKALIIGALTIGAIPLLTSSNYKGNEISAPLPSEPPAITETYVTATRPETSFETQTIIPTVKPEESIKMFEPISNRRAYYNSIYDQSPMGYTEQNGIIIRYYLLNDGVCVKTIDTDEDLRAFIREQGENVRNFTWKVAVCSLDTPEVREYIANGKPIPASLTTFFTDYELKLDIDFDQKDPTI